MTEAPTRMPKTPVTVRSKGEARTSLRRRLGGVGLAVYFSLVVVALIFQLGCGGRDCNATCQEVIKEGCDLPSMVDCRAYCGELSSEAATAECTEQYTSLEYCLGLDPVCAGDSRCTEEVDSYNACVRAYCELNPDACSP